MRQSLTHVKLYSLLQAPIQDPDYDITGKVLCLMDTDDRRVEIDFKKDKNMPKT